MRGCWRSLGRREGDSSSHGEAMALCGGLTAVGEGIRFPMRLAVPGGRHMGGVLRYG